MCSEMVSKNHYQNSAFGLIRVEKHSSYVICVAVVLIIIEENCVYIF